MKFALGDASSDMKVLSFANYALGIWTAANGVIAILFYFGPGLLGAITGNTDCLSLFLDLHFWLMYGFVFMYVPCGCALIYVGKCLARRIHFWRVVIFSIVGLFVLPFGLAIGAVTLSVMTRKTVRELFTA
jgi:hypothetical protein